MQTSISRAQSRPEPSGYRRVTPARFSVWGIGNAWRLDERLVGLCRRLLAIAIVGALLPAPAVAQSTDRVDGTSPKQLGIPAAAMPEVSMNAGLLVTEDGRVLWSRRADDRRAIASLTKVMTAVVALESPDAGQEAVVPRAASAVGESTSFLTPGERLPFTDLLRALLVKSGNDAAIAVAAHVAGDEDRFVERMNSKAAELGLTRTRFANAHGLDEEGHYSTASDLSILARYAMRKPEFRDTVGRKTARVGIGSRSHELENTNLLLGNYEGANGIKTGWTDEAGYCLVASADRGGTELYAVVLGTATEMARFRDARDLLDWGFAHYRSQKLVSAGSVIGEASVVDYLDRTVAAAVSEDVTMSVFDLAGPIQRSVNVADVSAPIEPGQTVGVATFSQKGRTIASVPLVATEAVEAPNIFERSWIAVVRGWRKLFGGPMRAPSIESSAAVSY